MADPAQSSMPAAPKGDVAVDLAEDTASPAAASGTERPISYHALLFSGADRRDILMLAVGLLCAIIHGCLLPLFSIVFGKFIDEFGNYTHGSDTSAFTSQASTIALQFVYIALGVAVSSYFEVTMLMLSGNRQTNRLKQRYLDAVLRQDIAFFDTQATTGGLLQVLNDDSIAVQQAISEKLSLFVHYVATFVAGIVIAFTKGWDMTLVMLACVPFLIIIGAALARMTASLAVQSAAAYTQASGIAEQTISQIRTVFAYGQERQALDDYTAALEQPVQVGIKAAWAAGLSLGGTQFVMFCTYAVALIYGAHRVAGGAYTGGQVLSVLLATVIGGFSLGMAAPNLTFFSKGQVAATRMLAVINRHPAIVIEVGGEEPSFVTGEVAVQNITFSYPSRPDVCIFRDFSLSVPAGQSLALVGGSGSGKSTVVSLLERFYDPEQGFITLDGVDLRRLSLRWLRNQVGLVSQEPTLFATTVFENIHMGRPDATHEEVMQAARSANAEGFISALPKGYDTHVGERGMQLSGGQKQRIAIARALLKDPKVLLLDEATSALDGPSERIVQDALDRMVVGRTTLVIAHRLSTIRSAAAIAVMHAGQVVERGSHEELLQNTTGAYSALVQLQTHRDGSAPPQAASVQAASDVVKALPDGLAAAIAIACSSGTVAQQGPASDSSCLVSRLPTTASLDPLLSRKGSVAGGSSIAASSFVVPRLASGDTEAQALHIEAALGWRPLPSSMVGCESGWWRLLRRCSRSLGILGGSSRDRSSRERGAAGHRRRERRAPVAPAEVSMWRLLELNRPEWWLGGVGAVASAAAGCQQPAFAYVISSMVTNFYRTQKSEILHTTSFFCWMLFAMAVGSFLAVLAQQVAFGVMGQRLGRRVRLLLLAAILRQEVGWFDRKEHSSGQLTSSLATDATHVRGAVGDVAGMVLQSCATFACCYAIALIYDWRVALLITGCCPLLVAASALQFRLMSGSVGVQDKLYAGANQTVSDAFTAMRTIQAFNMQRAICTLYTNLQAVADRSAVRQANLGGLCLAFANSNIFLMFALVIWFGGLEISHGWSTFEGILHAFMGVLLAAVGIVQASTCFPDLAKAKSAIGNIFSTIDRIPLIDSGVDLGDTAAPAMGASAAHSTAMLAALDASVRGELEFCGVFFTYPCRPRAPVFYNFSLRVPACQATALVGESGSGKSTVVSLVERFYDVQGGSVTLDGIDLRQLSLPWLRSQMALVSQEPLLFRGSIELNIRFGRPTATPAEVRSAAAAANALAFIDALPHGFGTLVGEAGLHLSGGQKQRIAIARAILKDPKVLLLDEATSALDAHSESVVQAALDRVMVGRTSLVVAHRLSTVQGAGTIAVMSRGAVLEQGTHFQLLAQQGHYAQLLATQAAPRQGAIS